jgi:phage tail-like protein
MRMLGSLERVLDPHVAILDCLAAYLSPRMAPEGMVTAMAAWLGQPPSASYGQSAGRGLLGVAEKLALLRGTRAGLELALKECFPKLHFEVEDHGSVLHAGATDAAAPYPGFTVKCREPLSPIQREQVQGVIDWQRPLQVKYTLLDATDARKSQR